MILHQIVLKNMIIMLLLSGIDLPSFNFSYADYMRKSGESELYDLDINNDVLLMIMIFLIQD